MPVVIPDKAVVGRQITQTPPKGWRTPSSQPRVWRSGAKVKTVRHPTIVGLETFLHHASFLCTHLLCWQLAPSRLRVEQLDLMRSMNFPDFDFAHVELNRMLRPPVRPLFVGFPFVC